MPHFGETPAKPVTETSEEKAKRLAGDLELAPLEGEEGETKKAETEEGEKTSPSAVTTETPQVIAQQAEAQTVEDNAAADVLAEQIKSGNIGTEARATEVSQEKQKEETLEAPKTEMFKKYGHEMRSAASELVGVMNEMKANDGKIYDKNLDMTERKKAQDENEPLNKRRNQLLDDATFGSNVIQFRGYVGGSKESYDEYRNNKLKTLAEYRSTAMQDPQIILHLAEAGQLSHGEYRETEGVGQIDEKLRGNSKFMAKVLETLSKKGAESFFVHLRGEARTRDLYIAAVKKNALNYQWGEKDWATDPEIQKIALESGLDPMYLQK